MEKNLEKIREFIEQSPQIYLPHLSVDSVIFGFEEGCLKVLLLEFTKGKWALPGGFVKRHEDVGEAVIRVLAERTQLQDIFLRQFYTFGKANRDFTQDTRKMFDELDIPWQDEVWIANRFISVGYYALVNLPDIQPKPDFLSRSVGWYDIYQLPPMMMDHREIAEKALEKLREDLANKPIAAKLLPSTFTMPELHKVVQVILQKETDRSRFQKKMLASGYFERLAERRKGLPHRSPFLYRYLG